MRKLMKYTVAAAIIVGGPLLAQDSAPPVPEPGEAMADSATNEDASAEMTPEQLRAYGLWPDDRRAMFDTWPAETQGYYWTLTPPRQEVFWMLSDADKITVTGMSEDDREQTWQRLEQQMLASQPPVDTSAPPEPTEAPMPPVPDAPPAPDAPDSAGNSDSADEPMTEVEGHSPR